MLANRGMKRGFFRVQVNVMVAQSMLKRLGLVADVAYNGLEAVKAIKRSHYDLVQLLVLLPSYYHASSA